MDGRYEEGNGPDGGLAVARMIGHLSYLSEFSFEKKFGREKRRGEFQYDFGHEFQVESYLSYQADKFTARFDANSLLYLTRAIDYYECKDLSGAQASFLVTAFTSDWLYPPHQAQEIHDLALQGGNRSRLEVIDLPFGHDAFLLDGEIQGRFVREFLA
jgi:homoserine O-acetyltransferase